MTTVMPPGSGIQAFPRVPVATPRPAGEAAAAPPPPELQAYEPPAQFQAPAPEPSEAAEPGRVEQEMQADLERLGRIFEAMGSRLQYGAYEGTNEFYAKVIDRRTNEVVKFLPPEEILALRARLREASGVFLNELV